MKVISKPIEVIAWFKDGTIKPIKFKIEEDSLCKVIVINKIMKSETEKLAGKEMKKFVCCSCINGVEKIIELKYDISTSKWILFKY